MTRAEHSQWTLHVVDGPGTAPEAAVMALAGGVEVAVPESVLGALVRLGLAPDVAVGGDEADITWATEYTWAYRTTVPRSGDGRHVSMVFEGVDTFATVFVDGERVLETANMFHAWTVDLGVDTGPGSWRVEVVVHPVLPLARALEATNPLPRADMYELPYNQVRKMASSFGWDWGPTTVTSGLWRRVVVERHASARVESLLLSPTWDNGAVLRGDMRTHGEGVTVTATVRRSTGGDPIAEFLLDPKVGEFRCEVPEAERWNTIHRGARPLYDVTFDLIDVEGRVVDTLVRRVGFRAIELVQEVDEIGRRFEIHVNGKREWIRGYNWIPADVLPERVTRDTVRRLVGDAVESGANMLRVWGGGVVESDDFYDVCDELGVLVWQDFGFACAAYRDDEAAQMAVRREVDDAVSRVGHRASLALWCGSNENLWGYEDWGWKEKLPEGAGWGGRLYHDAIPSALALLDPHRPYIPGSPFSPDADAHPNDPTQGTTHHWDTWNQLDYVHFEDKASRFASEFGWQAPASWPTLVEAMGHEIADGDDPSLQRLQKHPEGRAALARAIADHVPHLPKDGRGWYLATQLVQARALEASIGRFRSLHESCSGALWWQLNDCWPALSWAAVDVAGRRKLAWHAAARAMAPRAVVVTAEGDAHALTVINDTDADWSFDLTVTVVDEAGDTLAREARHASVGADGCLRVGPTHVSPRAAAVVVDAGDVRGVRWIAPDLELEHPAARVRLATAENGPHSVSLTITAESLVRDLVVLAETDARLSDACVDRQLFTLLPGESQTLVVSGAGVTELSATDWASLVVCGTEVSVVVDA